MKKPTPEALESFMQRLEAANAREARPKTYNVGDVTIAEGGVPLVPGSAAHVLLIPRGDLPSEMLFLAVVYSLTHAGISTVDRVVRARYVGEHIEVVVE